jgi:hypothetical protein
MWRKRPDQDPANCLCRLAWNDVVVVNLALVERSNLSQATYLLSLEVVDKLGEGSIPSHERGVPPDI